MESLTKLGTLIIGATLVVGAHFFPNFTIMWFASPDVHMELWRQALLTTLLASIIIKMYFDNPYLHIIRAILSAMLLWVGITLFLDSPAYIFDVMFIMSLGICFAIDALQKIPVEVAADAREAVILGDWLRNSARQVRPRWRTPLSLQHAYRSAIRDESHVLVIR